ncbi:MAG: ATP-dependent Clp protease ATP-binding subunit [Bryobacterales bacterium]|nr:ATP-dependent Clp protease ATP-binding subunit [Bryobacterales bacterium]MBV9401924.1 ATP-dependent Clp protease ATP-binding subunit [Bryobacterales bacterium]
MAGRRSEFAISCVRVSPPARLQLTRIQALSAYRPRRRAFHAQIIGLRGEVSLPGPPIPIRPRRATAANLANELARRVVGQPHAMEQIVPYVQMHRAGLAPEGRPAGVFLLLGPTGTGKTRTVEALAEVLHGSEKSLLKVDCGEFQMEHEVAKLIGAPPGYLGHRETQPMLTQQKVNSVASESCNLSLLLFDEIEKAASSMTRLLLGVLDKAVLRLGDNSTVNFERSLIFLTSNLGAEAMRKELAPNFGFEAMVAEDRKASAGKIHSIGMGAVRRKFSPEFVNRIDAVIAYQPLERSSLEAILHQQIQALERHIGDRLEDRAFELEIGDDAFAWLLRKGTSCEYGARELKRTILRSLTQPIAAMVESGRIPPESLVRVEVAGDRESLDLVVEEPE